MAANSSSDNFAASSHRAWRPRTGISTDGGDPGCDSTGQLNLAGAKRYGTICQSTQPAT